MIENRKEEHIRIAEGKEVKAQHNFWDDITLIHRAMPEVDYDSIKTGIDFIGNRIDYPMIISSIFPISVEITVYYGDEARLHCSCYGRIIHDIAIKQCEWRDSPGPRLMLIQYPLFNLSIRELWQCFIYNNN